MNKSYFRKEILRASGYFLPDPGSTVKLDQNELPYDIPEPIKDEILGRLKSIEWNRYPRFSNPALRKRLGLVLGWSPDGIVVANGSNVLIQAVIIASSLGKPIITVKPTFGLYRSEAELFGSKVIEVSFDGGFKFPLEKILKAIKSYKPRLSIFANPNAQTGTLADEDELIQVVKKASGLVVIDEAYFEFSGTSLLPRLKKYPNLILLRTFSKAFGLGGVRIGYLIAAPGIAENVQKAVLPFCLNSLSEAIALSMLDHLDLVSKRAGEIAQERDQLYSKMKEIEGVSVVPSSANFLLFKVKGQSSKSVYKNLVSQGYSVRDVSDRDQLRQCLRVSVGSPEHNRGFLEALANLAKIQ